MAAIGGLASRALAAELAAAATLLVAAAAVLIALGGGSHDRRCGGAPGRLLRTRTPAAPPRGAPSQPLPPRSCS